jgi:hypothetical protein
MSYNHLKTSNMTRKSLLLGSLLLGAFLLVTPALTFASTTKYTNTSGENATVNVTDPQMGATFTILAAGSPGLTIPFITTTTLTPIQGYIYQVGGTLEYKANGQTYYETGYAYGATCGYTTTQCFLPGGYGYGSGITSLLAGMHSTYMFTGVGAKDVVKLTGGITNDIFSITTPGLSSGITVNAGLGNSTYNLVMGPSGTITINAAVSTGAYNSYNIVYGYNQF